MRLSHLCAPVAIALATSLAGTVTTPVFASETEVERTDNYTRTCGRVTCSTYYTKEHTKKIRDTLNRFEKYNMGGAAAAGVACALLFVPAPVCLGITAATELYITGLTTYADKAGDQDRCLKLRTPILKPGTPTPPWFSTDTSRFCR